MAESEDRTQEPSRLRRQQARESGQVAQSPELTGAAALLAGALLLGVVGEPLGSALLAAVREPWASGPGVAIAAATAVARLRAAAFAVLGPLATLMLGVVAAGFAAHRAQVGTLWSPGLVAPDPARLWGVGPGRGLAARAGRGFWSLAKTGAVLAVAIGAIRSRLDGLAGLGTLDTDALASAWAAAARGLLLTMAAATLALGLLDYALQRRRFEATLRTTPDEAREDRKSTDGDPALRGRRRRLARAWRGDAPELLAGASLVVVGPRGLAVVLAGGPPPGAVSVRSAADGATGANLRRSAEAAGVAVLDRADLATPLARLGSKPNAAIDAGLIAALKSAWPASR